MIESDIWDQACGDTVPWKKVNLHVNSMEWKLQWKSWGYQYFISASRESLVLIEK